MIPETVFLKIAKGLLEKTVQGNLNWSRSDEQEFSLDLDTSRVFLRFKSPSTAPDFLELEITVKKGKSSLGKWAVSQEESGWPILADLFFQIERRWGDLGPVMHELENRIGVPLE